MYWLPYVIFREMYLQTRREYVESHMQLAWRLAHAEPGPDAIPNFGGC